MPLWPRPIPRCSARCHTEDNMSFILDALKKSESERHRNSGPVLMDVRIAPPRRRLPAWAWVIIAVLVANFMVLAWLLWLSPRQSPPVQGPAAADVPGP